MILTRLTYKFLLGGTLALSLLAAAPHSAKAAPAGVPIFGSVDIGRIQTESTRKAKYDAELRALADRLDNAFKQQASSIMLNKADQTELGTLLSKSNPSDADRARITALQSKAAADAQQLTDLQQKKEPTPADTAKLTSLTNAYQTGQATLQAVGESYQAQLKKLSDDDTTEFTKLLKDAITAVAQQKNLSAVFTSDVAIYTTNDITSDVVKRVNSAK